MRESLFGGSTRVERLHMSFRVLDVHLTTQLKLGFQVCLCLAQANGQDVPVGLHRAASRICNIGV